MKRTILLFSLAVLTVGAFAQNGSTSNDDFFKHNPEARNVHWNGGNQLIIQLKSGKEEAYNLNNKDHREAVIARYGSLPVAPPPPPTVKTPPPPPTKTKKTFKTPAQVLPPPPPKVEVMKFTPPVIVKDDEKLASPPPPAPPKVRKKESYS